ncbi:MAG: hypothetical protein ACKV0T_06330 [Planctomycetales bacterium]
MSRVIHARVDAKTDKMLVALRRRLGWSESQVVREGIKALNGLLVPQRRKKVIGLGRFESGVPDLGTNKKHLKGFGE